MCLEMSNDLEAAHSELRNEISRLRTNLDALLMRTDLPNRELVEWSAQLVDVMDDCLERGICGKQTDNR